MATISEANPARLANDNPAAFAATTRCRLFAPQRCARTNSLRILAHGSLDRMHHCIRNDVAILDWHGLLVQPGHEEYLRPAGIAFGSDGTG